MLKRTPLYETHAAAGAKLVDFGGWEMPLHYGSQIDEHHAVRRDAGMFDVSHMTVVDLRGARTREFLLRLLANSVNKLKKPGKALYSCLLNEQGGVIDTARVAQPEELLAQGRDVGDATLGDPGHDGGVGGLGPADQRYRAGLHPYRNDPEPGGR